MDVNSSPLRVAVIGGGLVGALEAVLLARRGHHVDLYEYREDIRRCPNARGRSINLALSHRGRAALRAAALESTVLAQGVPMRGRMLHAPDGRRTPVPYDVLGKECIYSVNRKFLNEILLSAAETFPNVNLHFNHKLVAADFDSGELTFQAEGGARHVPAPQLLVGADGAHSRVRAAMLRRPGFDFRQSNIEHAYLELRIPPAPDGTSLLQPVNYLHIWPRGSFMLIALPNEDASWTVTLFAPSAQLGRLCAHPHEAPAFFRERGMADALLLLGEEQLRADFAASEPSLLLSVKCEPFNVGGKVVVIGDAAHAMVPFYGQGMNAGFEDCLILDGLLEKFPPEAALNEFSRTRVPDAHAICDLAMYNYVEMRDLVARPSYKLRRCLDSVLHRLAPGLWMPLYQGVTFSRRGYKWCMEHRRRQDKVLRGALTTAGVAAAAVLARWLWDNFEVQEMAPLKRLL
ncbi:hypothetical protein R5R35_011096 [Gryllus longicercus]|uniref:Kynurenine 3-monooxygenase n=1 Tax=Gryllus longicercus TaxID=2509291 RepID=A0AAN9ZAH8_9ORTH